MFSLDTTMAAFPIRACTRGFTRLGLWDDCSYC